MIFKYNAFKFKLYFKGKSTKKTSTKEALRYLLGRAITNAISITSFNFDFIF